MTPAKFTRTTVSERESLGERLAKKRNSLHLDIKDVERALRIPAKHIRYMEEGNYGKLPPDVYVRGFLRNYAVYLGLKPKKIIDAYTRERGLERRIKRAKKEAPVVKPLNTPRIVVTPKKMIAALSLAVVITIMVFIGWQIKILTAPPTLSIKTPNENVTSKNDYVYVEGQTDRESDLYINDVRVGTDDNGVFKERVSLQDGINVLKIKAVNKMKRETVLERKILVKLPASALNIDKNLYPLELKIVIGPNPVELEVSRDGEKLNLAHIMLPGSTQTFNAKKEIVVSTNNAGSTKIFLNNKALGPMGKEGYVIKDKKFIK